MRVPCLDHRPIIIAVAGSNGSGKTTFYRAFLQSAGLRFINADVLRREFGVGADQAADLAKAIRCELVNQRESFVFETVFSDPVGDKRQFLRDAAQAGYTVVLCFIGVSSADVSEERVAMRVTQGGHDVPTEKLASRFPRTLANLMAAVQELPCVLVFDNDDLAAPFRPVATFLNGKPVEVHKPIPAWLRPALAGYPR
jgi:predicted ABC-type ATPase